MEQLVTHIAKSLVDKPDAVQISCVEEDGNFVLALSVDQDDLGKVIGKQGRTARAIRTLLAVAAEKQGVMSRLDIVEQAQ